MIANLEEAFSNLHANQIKLNPKNCIFGVPAGKLLGFIVSEHSIKINPEKIPAINDMELVKNMKGAQRIMGCLAALNRFISRLGERGMPLYKLLKKSEHFEYRYEAQDALTRLKEFLTTPLVLTFPTKGRPCFCTS